MCLWALLIEADAYFHTSDFASVRNWRFLTLRLHILVYKNPSSAYIKNIISFHRATLCLAVKFVSPREHGGGGSTKLQIAAS